MKNILRPVLSLSLMSIAAVSYAAGDYNDAPRDAQFKQCVAYSNKNYEGGSDKSPIAGQTKVVAFCECMWNETPEDFKGDLAKFAETDKGQKINRVCEKYSGWQS
ncbi:MAG: hypothetical protein HZC24_05735 [Rhodocyclales bacterium]|nr:hypothetical protein [Rhodocyclales bacterium]